MRRVFYLLFIFLAAGMFVSSCVKDPDTTTGATQDDIAITDNVQQQDNGQQDNVGQDTAGQDNTVQQDNAIQPDNFGQDTAGQDNTVQQDNAVQPDNFGQDTAGQDNTVQQDNAVVDNFQPPDENAGSRPTSMTVSVTTVTYGGQFSPKNVFAVWMEKTDQSYLHTMGAWAKNYKSKLTRWASKSGSGSQGMTDAVTGASRTSHGTQNVTWKLTDASNQPVPDGTYTVYFELNETNGGSKTTTAQIQLGATSSVTQTNNTANIKDINIQFVK